MPYSISEVYLPMNYDCNIVLMLWSAFETLQIQPWSKHLITAALARNLLSQPAFERAMLDIVKYIIAIIKLGTSVAPARR